MANVKRSHNALRYFAVLAISYLLLSLLLPGNRASQAQYNLSSLQYHVLLFIIVAPLVGIWFVAFYGYAKMKEYAALVHDTGEGPAFEQLAYGLTWLAWGLPIPALISLLVTTIANGHPDFYAASIIITNYANLIIPVVALSVLATGSRLLSENNRLRISIRSTKILIFLFVVLGAVYCYLIFKNLGSTQADATNNPYFMPNWLVLTTIVIPYLYSWFIGLLAAYEIRLVSKHTKGVIYKRALDYLSWGIAVTVGSSIALQYFRSVFPRSGRLSLGLILIIVYCLIFIIGVGYGLLAYGANKLKKIEEV